GWWRSARVWACLAWKGGVEWGEIREGGGPSRVVALAGRGSGGGADAARRAAVWGSAPAPDGRSSWRPEAGVTLRHFWAHDSKGLATEFTKRRMAFVLDTFLTDFGVLRRASDRRPMERA